MIRPVSAELPEPFSRKKGIPYTLSRRISETAREYFVNREQRFELNAILPDTSRIEYIERKLKENGVRGKVIPPDDRLRDLADEKYRTLSAVWVAEVIEELISGEEFKKEVADEFAEKFNLPEARISIEKRFEGDPTLSWRAALAAGPEATQEEQAAAFKTIVEKKLRERLAR